MFQVEGFWVVAATTSFYLLMVVTLAARSLTLCFLLVSDTCHPSPVWVYIYAIVFHTSHFTLKREAGWPSEMLVCYHNTT
jgi:hypothetical protein